MEGRIYRGDTVRHKDAENAMGRGEVKAVWSHGYATVLWYEYRDAYKLTDKAATGVYRIENLAREETEE